MEKHSDLSPLNLHSTKVLASFVSHSFPFDALIHPPFSSNLPILSLQMNSLPVGTLLLTSYASTASSPISSSCSWSFFHSNALPIEGKIVGSCPLSFVSLLAGHTTRQ
jgi:hypothetical protein